MSTDLRRKLIILADAAKYDASCASGSTTRRDSRDGDGLGSAGGPGICHSFTPDGRCVSLLKLLLTNVCIYDCVYCQSRRSSQIERARFTVDEVVSLTLDFYRRNLIEGLFLSSGIVRSADHTMQQLVDVARTLRTVHRFRGYIHLKAIPEAGAGLLAQAGRYADRLSINVELPTEQSLGALAPQKSGRTIRGSMKQIREIRDESRAARDAAAPPRSMAGAAPRRARPAGFAPAGQSTQMIIGADASTDRTILAASTTLYRDYDLKRVYYSAFSPITDASSRLPLTPPPLAREHRLYQADWLIRFYGFGQHEITRGDGMLDLDVDPKMAWALANPDRFPVDVNRADRELLLRVPGLGPKSVDRILTARHRRSLRRDDIGRLRVPRDRVLAFVTLADHVPGDPVPAGPVPAAVLPAGPVVAVQMPLFQ